MLPLLDSTRSDSDFPEPDTLLAGPYQLPSKYQQIVVLIIFPDITHFSNKG